MIPDYSKLCPYNVVIFNRIKNNEKDIQLLEETFDRLNCRVRTYQDLTLPEYQKAIEEICRENFSIYEYIVIVILDNKNKYNHLITTKDGHELLINNDLLVRITQNITLADKKRLFIIQTNQVYSDNIGKTEPYKDPITNQPIKLWAGPTVHLISTGPEFELDDYWPNPEAPASPFIASFCKNFARQAEIKNNNNSSDDSDEEKDVVQDRLTIQKIFDDMKNDLKDEDTSVIKFSAIDDVYYGMALTDSEKENFFPEI